MVKLEIFLKLDKNFENFGVKIWIEFEKIKWFAALIFMVDKRA